MYELGHYWANRDWFVSGFRWWLRWRPLYDLLLFTAGILIGVLIFYFVPFWIGTVGTYFVGWYTSASYDRGDLIPKFMRGLSWILRGSFFILVVMGALSLLLNFFS